MGKGQRRSMEGDFLLFLHLQYKVALVSPDASVARELNSIYMPLYTTYYSAIERERDVYLSVSRATTMAAPSSITTLNLSATWVMVGIVHFLLYSYPVNISQNKTLSDDTDEVLRLQGVSWFTRRAIALATITLYVRHYKGDDGVERIDIDQKLTGIPGTSENRTLDWTSREHDDYLFGPVLGKSRRANVDEIENEFLRGGWLADTVQDGVINSYVESNAPRSHTSWIAEQVCQPSQHVCLQNGLPPSDLGIRTNK
jgi:hypothetical protein